MRKKEKLAALLLTSVISAALISCYQDVEVDVSKPGSLLPLAGVYNARDVGGYATFYDMARGRALDAFNKARIAWEGAGKPTSGDVFTALKTAWNALQSGYPELNLTEINDASGLGNMQKLKSEPIAKDGSEKASEKGIQARHVKKGYIIRSGDLSLLTDKDIKYLQDFGIQAVIDFRGIYPMSGGRGTEQGGDVDRLNFAKHGILAGRDKDPHKLETGDGGKKADGGDSFGEYPTSNHYDFNSESDKDTFGARFAIEEGVVGSMDTYLGPDNSAKKTFKAMVEGYKKIIENNAKKGESSHNKYMLSGHVQYANFFHYLIYKDGKKTSGFRDQPVKVIFHCSAGKDRTGMAAALFYSALGVPRETIINDYMLSAQYVAEKYYPVIFTLGDQMAPLVTVSREYIESFFDHIESTNPISAQNVYPNVSYDKSSPVIAFLTKNINTNSGSGGLGLSMDEIYHLRKLYLE